MTLTPKWQPLLFGCGLLFRKRRNCAWVGAGFGSAEEIPGRRAFPFGRRCALTFRKRVVGQGLSAFPRNRGRRQRSSLLCDYRPQRERQSPGDCISAPPPIAPHECRTAHTPPHVIFTRSARSARATPVRADGTAAERVRKPTRFFEPRRVSAGRKEMLGDSDLYSAKGPAARTAPQAHPTQPSVNVQ